MMVYGLAALFTSMVLLVQSNWFFEGNIDYWIIMMATAFLGAGFGFTITALNPFAYNLFPGRETSAVTAMHIMLGLGTASSAILLNYFHGTGHWWIAPTVVGAVILFMVFFTLRVPLKLKEVEGTANMGKRSVPFRIWLFTIAVFLYGACEATFGNFGAVFLEKEAGLSLAVASIGLSLFWGGITLGRVLFTFIALRYSTKWLYIISPFLVCAVFYLLPYAQTELALLSCMTLGGLGLSFLFPKSISSATDEYPKYAALISGALVAAIQLGTGFSSNVIGMLNMKYSLYTLFQFSALYALILGILVTYLMLSRK